MFMALLAVVTVLLAGVLVGLAGDIVLHDDSSGVAISLESEIPRIPEKPP